MSTSSYACGKQQPLVQRLRNHQEIPRVRLKLKVVTRTYILQVNRSSFNQNRTDPVCFLCQEGSKTMQLCNNLYPVNDAKTLIQHAPQ